MAKGSELRPGRARAAGKLLTGYPTVIALLAAYWALAVTSTLSKCPTSDEIVHLPAGYSYWRYNDYRLNPENGNLPGRWAALPLLAGGYRFPSLDQADWWQANEWAIGHQFFYETGNDVETMLLSGRAMIALLGVALGLAVYLWSRRLFGPAGGMISLALYAFSPTMLAHGRLMTSDMAAALFFALSMAALWRVLHKITPWTLLASCAAMGALFVSKMSGVLAVPMGLLLVGIRLLSGRELTIVWRRPRQLRRRGRRALAFLAVILIHALAVAIIVWCFYGFRYSAFRAAQPGRDELLSGGGWREILQNTGQIGRAVSFARRRRLLPEAYLYGFAYAYKYSLARPAFLNGQYSLEGWWYFFPYCFLVKTPLGILLAVVLAGLAAWAAWRPPKAAKGRSRLVPAVEGLYRTAPFWVLLAVYWVFAVRTNLNIGHRHVLPTYAPMFVLAGAAAWWLQQRRRVPCVLLALAGASLVVESLLIRPHYLAYFNPLAGGARNGYRHLVDSSLDWGQDLPGLKRWLDRNGLTDPQQTPVYLSYFGTGSPTYYRIRAERLVGFPDRERTRLLVPVRGGVYCISATMLQTVLIRPGGAWTSRHEARYQSLRESLGHLLPDAPPTGQWKKVRLDEQTDQDVLDLDTLRFGRLCAFLRRRRPDDHVGYSILIYRLSDKDVRDALLGPPAELRHAAPPLPWAGAGDRRADELCSIASKTKIYR